MALSSRVKNKIVDTINTTFAGIGNANGMRMPKSDGNQEPLAWEMLIAQHLARIADKRKLKAEAEAAKAGLIPDKERDPQPPGKRFTYKGNTTDILMEVRNPSRRVKAELLIDYLVAHGVKQELIDAATVAATTYSERGSHVFTAMWSEE